MFWQAEAGRVIQAGEGGRRRLLPKVRVVVGLSGAESLDAGLRGIVQLWEKSGAQREKWMLGVWWAFVDRLTDKPESYPSD